MKTTRMWEDLESRVIPAQAAAEEAKAWRRAGEIVAFTNGCFDLLHVGHLLPFLWARRLADHLIVGLNDDRSVRNLKGPTRPILPERDRALMLAALRMVDRVVLFSEPTADRLLWTLKPHFYVKGGDYRLATLPEKETVLATGVRVIFVPLVPGHSTSGIIARIGDGRREDRAATR